MPNFRLPLLGLLSLALAQTRLATAAEPTHAITTDLVFFHEAQLAQSKAAIASGDPAFVVPYQQLIADSDALLSIAPDPVTNKSIIPPSGDRHDYLSYAPYRWPDETKADGLPWIPQDGVINPVSRTSDTDHERLHRMFEAVEKLSFAFYFSGEQKYADQTLAHLNAWFVADETRVNPNLQFSQSIPGLPKDNPAGFIDWSRFSRVITAVQLLDQAGALPPKTKTAMARWFEQYLDYMVTSNQGHKANALPQNHANWYNCQVVGMMIYLGRTEAAKARVIDAKTSRIAAQIRPSGEQPKETGRTKSMHYSCMNLWALIELTNMGRKLGIDLWEFTTEDGRSLPQAYRYLEPFAQREQVWPFRQITPGGAEHAIDDELRPLFLKTVVLLGLKEFPWSLQENIPMPAIVTLQYPSPSPR